MRLPPPQRLGLPEKFVSWRYQQERAIWQLLDDEVRFSGINAPAGTGKSAIALGLSQLLPKEERVLILTSTKALQDQYLRDSFALGLRDVRGKSNYQCLASTSGGELADLARAAADSAAADSFISVEHGPCFTAKAQCSLQAGGCQWFDALRAARGARIVSTNYTKWFTTPDPAEEFGSFDWAFLDEAAEAANKLTDVLHIEISRVSVESLLRIPWPAGSHNGAGTTRISDWREWANHHRATIDGALRTMESHVADLARSGKTNSQTMGRLLSLREVAGAVTSLRTLRGEWVLDDWKVYDRLVGIQIHPLWPAPYAESMLFRGIPRIVLMGATLVEKHLDVLGVPRDQRSFVAYPSTFPVMNRPVYVCKLDPPLKLSYSAEQDESVKRRVAEVGSAIARSRLDRKGIAHTVSYKRNSYILQRMDSDLRDIIVTHANNSESTRAAVARYKDAPPPALLFSPAVDTGWDFPDDEAEYCWIPKLPFVQRDSALMIARSKIDPKYSDSITAERIMQMCGRIVRGMTDTGESVISDAQMTWFPWANRDLFAPYFLQAIRTINGLPKPPPKWRKR